MGEIAERIIRKNEKLESTLPLTISAQYGLIDQNEFFDKRIASKDVRGYYLIKKGEFAYNKSTSVDAPFGAIKRLDKYKNGVLSTLYILFKIIDDTSTSSDYLVTYYFTDLWHNGIQSIAAEGARNHGLLNIAPNDFFETMLSIPLNISEQKKVGGFFISLDHLITLHQRKLEKLKIIKKSMLENLFPQNGEKTPKIRFSGFTKDWEQRKVMGLGKIYIGLVTTMTKHYTSEGTLLIRNSDIKDGRFEFGDKPIYLEKSFAQKNESRMHQVGDVITVHTGDVGTSAVITENEVKSIGFATIVTRPDQQIIDANYLCTFLNTDKHKKWAVAISTGDGRTNYNLGDYYELVVPIPSIREQQKISSFVLDLDNLITLHQSKLEKLQKIKKSMLESMFV